MNARILPFLTKPEIDEDYSSWLCRLAAGNGLTASKFLKLLLQDNNKANTLTRKTDIIRLNAADIKAVSEKLGIRHTELEKSTYIKEISMIELQRKQMSLTAQELLSRFILSKMPYCPPVCCG